MTPDRQIGASDKSTPTFGVEQVLVAGNRGPCGGVWKMFEQLDTAFDEIDKVCPETPLYINWYPVNNVPLTFAYEKRGLVNFKNDWSIVPENSLVIPSAHGVGPDFYEMAREKKGVIVADGTCQLVTRVHNLVKNAEDAGKLVVYVGKSGHPETEGVRKEIKDPENFVLIEEDQNISGLDLPHERFKVVYSQTTLSTREIAKQYFALLEKFGGIEIPARRDICYATDSRQMAVDRLLVKADSLIVVGSKISHNSQELAGIFEKAGKPSYLIDEPDEVQADWFGVQNKVQAITSGASVPDKLLYPVVARVMSLNPGAKLVHEEQVIPEDLEKVFKYDREAIKGVIRSYANASY